MARIQIERVSKSYDGKVNAVDDVDLEVRDGELLVLLGPSGCGKTTLLRTMAGLEYPERGRIRIGDAEVTALPPRRRDIAMVFQSYAVFPHLTVYDNIAFGLKMRGVDKTESRARVAHAAELVQLTDYLERYPAKLSGGQRQRVALARAVVMQSKVLLMDEPLSNLDALLRLQFRADLKKLVSDLATTTLYVTHDQVEALSLGDRVAVMRDGKIIQCDTPSVVYDTPATRFVGSFIGNPPMNFLRGGIERRDDRVVVAIGTHDLDAPDALAGRVGKEVLLGVRGERIGLAEAEAPGTLPAVAEVVEALGSHTLVTAVVEGQSLKVLTDSDFACVPGSTVWLRPDPGRFRWYDPDTEDRIVVDDGGTAATPADAFAVR